MVRMNGTLDAIDGTLIGMNGTLDTIHGKLVGLDKGLTKVGGGFYGLKNSLDSMSANMDELLGLVEAKKLVHQKEMQETVRKRRKLNSGVSCGVGTVD